MRLSQLLNVENNLEVSGLSLDTRSLNKGDVFFAIKGQHVDGRTLIAQALERGAAAVLFDPADAPNTVPHAANVIAVPDLSKKISQMAGEFYQNAGEKLKLIGVTGTNGKTSVTHYMARLLDAVQMKTAVVGTLGVGFLGELLPSSLTTPDPISVQSHLYSLWAQGAKAVAMEVSSHALVQGRVEALPFEVAVFTNLSRDHLDFHGDMASYAEAKKRLFTAFQPKIAVMNADDPTSHEWFKDLGKGTQAVAYGLSRVTQVQNAQLLFAESCAFHESGIDVVLNGSFGKVHVNIPLLGRFNLYNALAALAGVLSLSDAPEKVFGALSTLSPATGRMQLLGGNGMPRVVVDYAHTPDALQEVLKALRTHNPARIHLVFGCGGDRDTGKRSEMAKIAETLADTVIVTDDNPRTESGENIFADIRKGFESPTQHKFIHSRFDAIKTAIFAASQEDVVLVAGKGHEDYQLIQDQKLSFSDIEQVERILNERKATHPTASR